MLPRVGEHAAIAQPAQPRMLRSLQRRPPQHTQPWPSAPRRSCTPATIEEADFVMARGLFSVLTGPGEAGAADARTGQVAPYSAALEQAILARALDRGLPLLVSNPDVLRPDGKGNAHSMCRKPTHPHILPLQAEPPIRAIRPAARRGLGRDSVTVGAGYCSTTARQ